MDQQITTPLAVGVIVVGAIAALVTVRVAFRSAVIPAA